MGPSPKPICNLTSFAEFLHFCGVKRRKPGCGTLYKGTKTEKKWPIPFSSCAFVFLRGSFFFLPLFP
jgi:hypothetical protein